MGKVRKGDLERERLALQVFGEVCALPRDQRAARVHDRCRDDPLLRERVELLLGADDEPIAALQREGRVGDFLESEVRRISGAEADDGDRVSSPSRLPGHYRILRVLGEGGMATVYEAEQVHPRRSVAIKVIRGGLFSPELRRRFEYEAQVMAGLQHPGIARLYEAETRHDPVADEKGVRCYLAMELVRGVPIDEYVAGVKLPTAAILRLVMRVCDAVEYAHRKGVIHRDLKPANILVEVDGQPKVLDFGIARVLDRSHREWAVTLTGAGQLVGTLPYMSPEQVDARLGTPDTRSDVYALGVLLYKLLTGVLPIDTGSDSIPRAAERILSEQPMRLGARDRSVRGDLEMIVAKALAKDPERRYGSIQALADDLQRYLDGRAIEARADSKLYVLWKEAWRLRRTLAVAVGLSVLIVALAVYFHLQGTRYRRLADEAMRARDASIAQRELADAQARDLRRSLYSSDIALAQAAVDGKDFPRALKMLEACPADLRGWEWHYLQNAATGADTAAAPSKASVLPPAASLGGPDGTRRVSAADRQGRVATAGPDGRVHIRSGPDLRVSASTEPQASAVRAFAFTPDGTTLAVARDDGTVALLDGRSLRPLRELKGHTGAVAALAFHPDGTRLASGGVDHAVLVWAVGGDLLLTLRGHPVPVTALRFSSDGTVLWSADEGGTVRVWDGTPRPSQGPLR